MVVGIMEQNIPCPYISVKGSLSGSGPKTYVFLLRIPLVTTVNQVFK
jgi:hypothetical protein